MIVAEPAKSTTTRNSDPGRVAIATAPPDPATSTPTIDARRREAIARLRMTPAVTSVTPAAAGTSLKLMCALPIQRGVASVSDHANAPASNDRQATPMAAARAVTARTARISVAAPWY